jgi:hypothetical protein
MTRPRVADGRDGLQSELAELISNKQPRTADKGWSYTVGGWEGGLRKSSAQRTSKLRNVTQDLGLDGPL